jgi:hypothetical protein
MACHICATRRGGWVDLLMRRPEREQRARCKQQQIAMDEPSGSREVRLHRQLEARSAHTFTVFRSRKTFIAG